MKNKNGFVVKTVILLFFVVTSLTSCDVHFGDIHYDVPWWMIAVPVIVFSAAVWYFVGKSVSDKKYVCPKCNQTFYPKWWQAAFTVHVNDDRVFKCPHCGRKGFCHVSHDIEK